MGKITYINASPVYYGLDNGMQPPWMTLVPDVPAALNHKIKTGQIDISPISAAFYAMNHKDLLILPNLSISCHGKVLSVICASNYPLDELTEKSIMFSNESASGASFLKMIFAQRNIVPRFKIGNVGDITKVPDDIDAVMVIGDAALTQPWDQRFKYRLDLGSIWHEMTGLPFVFALWVVRKTFAQQHPERVRAAHDLLLASKTKGYENLETIIGAGQKKLALPYDLIKTYYDLLICDLDSLKIKAMGLFFDSLFDQDILRQKSEIRFFDPIR
ncbi:MAG: menaquinone biosynthesis protein [Desulfobacter sp.]|nr:menaquinone biosynthesis protein [Desulfobacter sp.]WDP88055.1 MAG: menaquinone biosynthesis protein [Desulfobacter sp.]